MFFVSKDVEVGITNEDGTVTPSTRNLDTYYGNGIFDNCKNLSSITFVFDQEQNIGNFIEIKNDNKQDDDGSLKHLDIQSSEQIQIGDESFKTNKGLLSIEFRDCVKIDSLECSAFYGSKLKLIKFDDIKFEQIDTNQYYQYDKSENMITDYMTVTDLPYFMYDRFYSGDMTGKKLYYGCIYDDYDSCVKFCIENKIPMVCIFSNNVTGYKRGNSGYDADIFGINTMFLFDRQKRQSSAKSNKETSTFAKKKVYQWIRQQPYIFCFCYSNKNHVYSASTKEYSCWYYNESGMTGYPQGWTIRSGLELYLNGGFTTTETQYGGTVERTDTGKTHKITTSVFTSNPQEGAETRNIGLIASNSTKIIDTTYDIESNMISSRIHTMYSDIKQGESKPLRFFESPSQSESMFMFVPKDIKIPYSPSEKLMRYGDVIPVGTSYTLNNNFDKMRKYFNIPDSMSDKEAESEMRRRMNTSTYLNAYHKALGYVICNDKSVKTQWTIVNTSHNEQILRLRIRTLEDQLRTIAKDYRRDSQFNHPEYKQENVDLSFKKIDYNKPFTCWGMDHDCEIWTSDHIKAKWNYKKQTLTKAGTL